MKTALLTSIMLFAHQALALACSVCFYGDPTQKANIALRQGIVALLVVLLGVLGAFSCFFISVARRAKLQNTD